MSADSASVPEPQGVAPGKAPASGPRLTIGWLIWLAMVLATQGVPRITAVQGQCRIDTAAIRCEASTELFRRWTVVVSL